MKTEKIINVVEQYNNYKKQLQQDKQELREYKLFDSHFGLNDDRIKDLEVRIRQNKKNLKTLLNADVKDVPMMEIWA